MAAITTVPDTIVPSTLAQYVANSDGSRTMAGEDFDAGAIACRFVDGTYGIADATGTDPVHKPMGVFVNSGGMGQPCDIVWYDPALLFTGSTFVKGEAYVLGLVGGINPVDDIASLWKVSPVCTANSATEVCWHTPMGSSSPLTVPTPAHA